MPLCTKCQRVLPPNGKCLLCGDAAYHRMETGNSHAPSALRKFLGRVLNVALVGGFFYGAYWLFFTEPGLALVDRGARALKFRNPRAPASPAQEILARFPRILPMIQDGTVRIQETKEDDRHFAITLITYRGATMETFKFLVNVETAQVTAQDDASAALLKA